MINFSTEFPIDDNNSVLDVIRLAIQWLTGSPHTKIPVSALRDVPIDAEFQFSIGDESVTVGSSKVDSFEIGGLRWVKIEGGNLEWSTSIVTAKSPQQHLLSMQVSCEALSTAARLPEPKKPIFVSQALTTLRGGMDGQIPVADRPFLLAESEVGIAGALILGAAGNRLPIVYVSAAYDGSHIVNPTQLGRLVSGMAHVVVEPSRSFSSTLRQVTSSRNAYGGTVAVYWPESNARKSYYMDKDINTARALQLHIAKDIRVALSNRRQKTHCSWVYLKETISKRRYETLKAEGSTELNKFVEAFDSELKAKESRIVEAEHEIARLNAEIRKLSVMSRSPSGELIARGDEQDLYDSEVKDFIVDALNGGLRNAQDGSRRQHVLRDLVDHNKLGDERTRLEEEIKSIFKTYVSMDTRKRSALEKLGFALSEDGKHHKAVFRGDGRYTFAISKTSSDVRAGKNMASDITRKLF